MAGFMTQASAPRRRNDLLREGLHLVREERLEHHEDEVRHADLGEALDGVETLLLVADHDVRPRFLRRRLPHVRYELQDELLALGWGLVAERHDRRLLDDVGIAADGVAVTLDDVDER